MSLLSPVLYYTKGRPAGQLGQSVVGTHVSRIERGGSFFHPTAFRPRGQVGRPTSLSSTGIENNIRELSNHVDIFKPDRSAGATRSLG